MFHQYWQSSAPASLFEQTQNEVDELFYATFPAARDAARNALLERRVYELPSPVDYSTLHAATQPFEYDIRNELDIGSSSMSFRDPNQEPRYPQWHPAHHQGPHPQQPFLSHHQIQPYHSPPLPIENESPVYIPPRPLYHHQYSSEPTSQYIPQSQLGPFPAREPAYLDYQPSNIPPQVTTDFQKIDIDNHLVAPHQSFRQLNRHMKPPTIKFPNDCQLGVMRLDRLADRSDHDSPLLSRSHPSPSETSPVTDGPSTSLPTEFLLKSAPSPSIGLSSLPSSSKTIPEKKPTLACLFCRGRKIACGAPIPGIKKMCNQCRKRGLTCYYPTESRRGMKKKKPPSDNPEGDAEVTTQTIKRKKKKKID